MQFKSTGNYLKFLFTAIDRYLIISSLAANTQYLTCTEKLMGSQLNLPHRINMW